MSKVKWDDSKAKQIIKAAGLKAAQLAMENVLTEAMDEAPKDSGDLRRSKTVSVDQATHKVYGSFSTPYAVIQHENIEYRHEVGKAKYLEDPFNRLKKDNEAFIISEMKVALRKARG